VTRSALIVEDTTRFDTRRLARRGRMLFARGESEHDGEEELRLSRSAPIWAPMDSKRADDVRSVMNSLRNLVRGLRLSARAAEREAGISGAQLFVLHTLLEGRAASLGELAERTKTDQSSVSVVVQRLVEQRLVARKASKADARRVEIAATARGRALVKRVPETTQARLVAAVGALSKSELTALRRSLGRVVDGLGVRTDETRMFFDEEPRKKKAE
jgi:DNA-binding MarR family transcriptional regulator